jgi:hypothetical protein
VKSTSKIERDHKRGEWRRRNKGSSREENGRKVFKVGPRGGMNRVSFFFLFFFGYFYFYLFYYSIVFEVDLSEELRLWTRLDILNLVRNMKIVNVFEYILLLGPYGFNISCPLASHFVLITFDN